jgi:hypothetical protein
LQLESAGFAEAATLMEGSQRTISLTEYTVKRLLLVLMIVELRLCER